MTDVISFQNQGYYNNWYQEIVKQPVYHLSDNSRNISKQREPLLQDQGQQIRERAVNVDYITTSNFTTGAQEYHDLNLPDSPKLRNRVAAFRRSNSSLRRSASAASTVSSRQFHATRKKPFQKPGYYKIPTHKKKEKRESILPNFNNQRQLDSIFKLLSTENLPCMPDYMIEYSIAPKSNELKWNPPLKYEIKKAHLIYNELYLQDTNLTMNEFLSSSGKLSQRINPDNKANIPNISSLRRGLIRQKSIDQMDKFGVGSDRFKQLQKPGYKLNPSANRLSTMAEISLASSSEHYNEYKSMIFSRNLKSWKELEILLESQEEIRDNDYLLTRLLFEIYLRRIVSSRMAIKMGIDQARKGDVDAWEKLKSLIGSVYGEDQTKFFEEQH